MKIFLNLFPVALLFLSINTIAESMQKAASAIQMEILKNHFPSQSFIDAVGHAKSEDLLKLYSQNFSLTDGHEVWFLLSSSNDSELNRTALAMQSEFACQQMFQFSSQNKNFHPDCFTDVLSSTTTTNDLFKNLKKDFEWIRNQKLEMTEAQSSDASKKMREMLLRTDTFRKLASVKHFSSYFCNYFQSNRDCSRAVKRVIQLVNPLSHDGSTAIAFGQEFEKIASSNKIFRGLMIAVPKILERVIEARQSHHVESNILQDLKDSFLNIGCTVAEAEDLSFSVLAVYSSRGAHLARLSSLFTQANAPIVSALLVISAAINTLDTYGSGNHYYSMGDDRFETDAIHWKPYHYWMSAFLSRKLSRSGFSKLSSFHAPLILAHLYEMNAPFWDRKPWAVFSSAYDSLNNDAVRIDLIYQTSGSSFGLKKDAPPALVQSLPGLFDDLILNGSPLPIMPEEEAKKWMKRHPFRAYSKWNKVFSTLRLHQLIFSET